MKEQNILKIITPREYVDLKTGKQVTVFKHVGCNGEELENPDSDEMMGQIPIPTKQGPVTFRFPFPEGMSLKECFIKFEEIGNEELEKEKAKHNKEIIIPGNESNGGIIIP